jgi:hypothetical protein
MGPTQWWFCEGTRGGCCNYLRCAVLLDCETLFVTESLGSSIHSFHGAWIFWTVAALGLRVLYFKLRHVVNDLQQMSHRPRLSDCIPAATNWLIQFSVTLQHYYRHHQHHHLYEVYVTVLGLQLFPGQWHRHLVLDKLISWLPEIPTT